MHLTSHEHVGDLVERRFELDDFRGILWTPASASPSNPAPLILAGQPGGATGLEQTHPRLLGRAHSAAEDGFATVTIELPGSGGRPGAPGVEEARRELIAAVTAGEPVRDDVVDRLVLPLVERAVPEWQTTLDAVLELPEITGPVGFSGGVISIGVRLALVEPRIAAAVLFAGSFVPRVILEEARQVTIPLHVLLQWDDEGNDRQVALDLFDAFGSAEKALNANLGGHTGVPAHAGAAASLFFRRHLIS